MALVASLCAGLGIALGNMAWLVALLIATSIVSIVPFRLYRQLDRREWLVAVGPLAVKLGLVVVSLQSTFPMELTGQNFCAAADGESASRCYFAVMVMLPGALLGMTLAELRYLERRMSNEH